MENHSVNSRDTVNLPERPWHCQEVLSTPRKLTQSAVSAARTVTPLLSSLVPLWSNLTAAYLDQTTGHSPPCPGWRGGGGTISETPADAKDLSEKKKKLKAVILRKIRVSATEKTRSCKRAPSLLRLGSPCRRGSELCEAMQPFWSAQVAGGAHDAIFTWDHSVFFLC